MVSISEVQKRLEGYLAGAESLEDFAFWLSSESSSIPYNADAELFDLIAAINNIVQVNFDGYLDSASLKNELSKLRDQNKVQEFEIQFVFDDPPRQSIKPDDLRPAAKSA